MVTDARNDNKPARKNDSDAEATQNLVYNLQKFKNAEKNDDIKHHLIESHKLLVELNGRHSCFYIAKTKNLVGMMDKLEQNIVNILIKVQQFLRGDFGNEKDFIKLFKYL